MLFDSKLIVEGSVEMCEPIEFLKELVNTNSVNPPGNEEVVAEIIAKVLSANGIASTLRPLGPKRAYLVARLKGMGNRRSLVFCGHMDTVPQGDMPWEHAAFDATEMDGRIYGRGTSDMKGGLAALTLAMIAISKRDVSLQGDIVLAATAGEEVDCLGARAMIEDGVLNDAGAMIIGEPSNGEIFVAHKGALWIEIVSYGKTAHGSMPEQGINAIDNMYSVMSALYTKLKFKCVEDDLLGGPTLNVATISGGVKTNVVPDRCRLEIDIRTVPGQDHGEILSDIHGLLKEIEDSSQAKFELKILNSQVAVRTPRDDPLIQVGLSTADDLFKRVHEPRGVRYFTDASAFVPGLGNDLAVLIYGPGNETMAHKPDEYVEVRKYVESIKFYEEVALRYLGGKENG